MPVPLNAFVDVVRAWFTERLDYLVNDSVPIKPAYEKRAATPSDIDLICKCPKDEKRVITFKSGRVVTLEPNLFIECKGWFDYSKPAFVNYLITNLNLLKKHGKSYLPKTLSSVRSEPHLFFLREEVIEEGQRRFKGRNFQRIVIGPFLIPPRKSRYSVEQLLSEYEQRNVIIVEIQDILCDLFEFIRNAKPKKKSGDTTDYNKLRKTFALEMLHLVNTYFDIHEKALSKSTGKKTALLNNRVHPIAETAGSG